MGRIADRARMANRWNVNGSATSMTSLTGRRGAAIDSLYRLLISARDKKMYHCDVIGS